MKQETMGFGDAVASAELDHMQTICASLQIDNHTNTSSLNFYRSDALPDDSPTKHCAFSALITQLHRILYRKLHRSNVSAEQIHGQQQQQQQHRPTGELKLFSYRGGSSLSSGDSDDPSIG